MSTARQRATRPSYVQKTAATATTRFAMLTIGLDALTQTQPPQSWR